MVMMTDWYAPHLADKVQAFTLERTASPTLMLGGGTTAQGAVCDKTPHRILAQRYKALEGWCHMNELKRRPLAVPKWTTQDVLDRGYEA